MRSSKTRTPALALCLAIVLQSVSAVPALAQVLRAPAIKTQVGAVPFAGVSGVLPGLSFGLSPSLSGTSALTLSAAALPSVSSIAPKPGALGKPVAAAARKTPTAGTVETTAAAEGKRGTFLKLRSFEEAPEETLEDGSAFRGIFDGEETLLDSFASSPYDPAVYAEERVTDRRYASQLESAWSHLAGSQGDEMSKKERRELQGQNALLERTRRRDPGTYAHMMRVGLMSGLLAMNLGYTKAWSSRLAWAATLHDVGKLNVEILKAINKKGKPTDEEWETIKRHPMEGCRKLLSLFGLPQSLRVLAARVALYHHEKWDGSGYPSNLKGKEIPLESRIIAVADVFDALMEHRPYRDAMSWEKALSIMMEMAPSSFDPEIFQSFLQMTYEVLGSPLPMKVPAQKGRRVAA